MNNVIVIDNVINELYQNELEKNLMDELSTPWFLLDDISYDKGIKNVDKNNYGLVHLICSPTGNVTSLYNLVLPLLYEAVSKVNFNFKSIIQARAFLQFPKLENVINHPHVDEYIPHLVVLYYVNDSDGDTIIYNEGIHDTTDLSNLTIKKQVSPKKGRAVIFDGRLYHSSSSPTIDRRCVLNFDVTDIE